MRRNNHRLFELGEKVPDIKLEQKFRKLGYKVIAGIDEAGRGPLAGPVVAGAVILPERIPTNSPLWRIRDSKKLSSKIREELFELIIKTALAVGIGEASPEEIDRFNIFKASLLAMARAIEALKVQPDFCLIDGAHPLPYPPCQAIIKGDSISLSIASASIIAKVARDRKMLELHNLYPVYNFHQNKGYGTKEHKQALFEKGPSPVHRVSFQPVRVCLRRV